LLLIPTILGITIISFSILHLAPGDPVDLLVAGASSGEGLSSEKQKNIEETKAELRRQLGLDKPLYVQYLIWLSNLVLSTDPLSSYERDALRTDRLIASLSDGDRRELAGLEGEGRKQYLLDRASISVPERERLVTSSFWAGKTIKPEGNYKYLGTGLLLYQADTYALVTLNLGKSLMDQRPVLDHITERLPITMELSIIGLTIAYLIGIPLGILLAVRQNTPTDRSLTTATYLMWSLPTFWVGMLLIIFLCNKEFFYWFPASGKESFNPDPNWSWVEHLLDHAYHMAMPILATTYSSFAVISRFMRTSMLENLRLDYVRTARAKGLTEQLVVFRHVLRNSLIPIVTLMAALLPSLFAGSVFIETIFTLPGMGFLAVQSVVSRDFPTIMAIFTISSVLSLVGILIADLLLKVVDPRISFGGRTN
jgi:peptide/nickel transport system permease protein